MISNNPTQWLVWAFRRNQMSVKESGVSLLLAAFLAHMKFTMAEQ